MKSHSHNQEPLRQGSGASFCTHHLVQTAGGRFLLKPTLGSQLFSGVFFLLGSGSVIAGAIALLLLHQPASLFMIGIGAIFAWVGYWLRKVMAGVREIDLAARRIRLPEVKGLTEIRQLEVPFDQIASLQIIRKTVYGENYYDSFELNIVRRNGDRINLLDHAGQDQIERTAERISSVLACEVTALDCSD